MPLEVPQMLIATFGVIALASGLWLLLNLRSVAAAFGNHRGIVPGPGPRTASRRKVIAVLIAFNLGWLASIGLWAWAIDRDASDVVVSD
ncbi:MAG: hypothetical protein JY451_04985 [Erythrobacter sp.]|nr:MAG: hypothetical protein JY451_04985 [Erythrobacter sp.]